MTMQPDQPSAIPPPAPPAPPMPSAPPVYAAPPGYPPAPPVYSAPPGYPSAPPVYSAPPGYAPVPPGYPPVPPGYPPVPPGFAPPPPRKSRVGLIVGLCVAMVLVLAVAGVTAVLLTSRALESAAAKPTRAVPTSAPATTPAAAPTTPTGFTGDLRTLLLTKPAGATPLSHEGAADGTLSLAEAAAPYTDSAQVAKEMRDLEYQQGAVTAWHDTKLRDVYVTLNQFRYEREAAQFAVELQLGLQNSSATDSSAYIDEIAAGRWFAEKKVPGNKTPVHAVFIKDNIMVDITVFANNSADIDFTKKTAIDQYARLP